MIYRPVAHVILAEVSGGGGGDDVDYDPHFEQLLFVVFPLDLASMWDLEFVTCVLVSNQKQASMYV